MTLLDDDFAAYVAAANPPAGDPLAKLLGDLVQAVNTAAEGIHSLAISIRTLEDGVRTLETTASTALATIGAFKQFEANVLAKGIVWNPKRLNQLADEGITPTG